MSRLIIFDFDGVMVDSFHTHYKNFIASCRELKIKCVNSKQEYLALCNKNFYEELKKYKIPPSKLSLLKELWISKTLSSITDMPIFPGIFRLVSLLKEDKLIIVSSNYNIVVEEILKANDINSFKEIYGADFHPSKTKKLKGIKNKHKDKDIFFICDTAGDIIEGKKAGLRVIATTWGFHNKNKLINESPDYLIESVEELGIFLQNRI
jgi:phosphoglycolate phosphatase